MSYQAKFESFQQKIVKMEAIWKLYSFVACLPNPCKLSTSGGINYHFAIFLLQILFLVKTLTHISLIFH